MLLDNDDDEREEPTRANIVGAGYYTAEQRASKERDDVLRFQPSSDYWRMRNPEIVSSFIVCPAIFYGTEDVHLKNSIDSGHGEQVECAVPDPTEDDGMDEGMCILNTLFIILCV